MEEEMTERRIRLLLVIAFVVYGLSVAYAGGQGEVGAAKAMTLRIYNVPIPGVPDPATGIVVKTGIEIGEAYEKLHPGVHIEWVVQPWTSEQDMHTWHITQLSAGTAPDIMKTQPNWIREDLGKGWWVSVDPYLAKQNPYNTKYKTWEDSFLPNTQSIWRLADGKRYTIQTVQQQVVFYYNVPFFKKIGAKKPSTWSELMSINEKIKAAGKTAQAWNLSDLNQLTWTSGWFTNFVMRNRIPELDKNGDGLVHDAELAEDVLSGKFAATDPGYRECLRLMKDFSAYWSPGAIGATQPTTYQEWLSEDAVIFLDGTWHFFGIHNDKMRKFEADSFYYPRLTTKDSKFITRDDLPLNNKAAGYGRLVGIPAVTKQRGTLDQAVDFLMYMTEPENMTKICQEIYFLPSVKDAIGNPLLKDIVPTLSYEMYPFEEEDVWLTNEYGTRYLQYWQDIFLGDLTLDDAAKKMQDDLMIAAQKVWDISQKAK